MKDPDPLPVPGRRPRSLRIRVTCAFALGSLVLVGVLGLVTYAFAEHYLVQARERSLLRQTFVDARILRDEMQRRQGIRAALDALELGARSRVLVSVDGTWYGTSVSGRGTAEEVPAEMRATVAEGRPAHQRVEVDGRSTLVVGLPLPSIGVQYYEMYTLAELDRTLQILRTALLAGGGLAVVLGGLLGWWMSRRVLRPVSLVAAAAERVAGGDLHTRITGFADKDLRSLAASFNEMVDAVERRIERESRFVADVSHELRSPLTTLSTATQLMSARRDELSERGRAAFDLLEVEVRRLRDLVEDLLELGRADAGVLDLQLEPVDLSRVVGEVLGSGGGGPNSPLVDAPAEPVLARVDKRRVERVLANLVSNAESHGQGLSRVGVTRRNGIVRLEVEDRGGGVDPREREAVFDRFHRGPAAGRRASGSGAGLGLALVAEHVQLHGGRVWIEDAAPCGARFVVELPAADDPSARCS